MARTKFLILKWSAILGAIAMLGIVGYYRFRTLPEARRTIGVESSDFVAATETALELLNAEAGCKFLVPGDNVVVSSSDGSPCGRLWDEDNREATGHSAGAYQCGPEKWEILISAPGDLKTQACIVIHELGHVAGLKDGGRHIMNQHECPEHILASDSERRYLAAKFCD